MNGHGRFDLSLQLENARLLLLFLVGALVADLSFFYPFFRMLNLFWALFPPSPELTMHNAPDFRPCQPRNAQTPRYRAGVLARMRTLAHVPVHR